MSEENPSTIYGVTLLTAPKQPIVTPESSVGKGGQGEVHIGTLRDPWALLAQRARWGEPERAAFFGIELPSTDKSDTRALLQDNDAYRTLDNRALEHWKKYQADLRDNPSQAALNYDAALYAIDPTITPNQRFALKRLDDKFAQTHLSEFVRESQLLEKLNTPGHPAIPKHYGLVHDPQFGYCIIMQLLEGKTVYDHMHKSDNPELKRKTETALKRKFEKQTAIEPQIALDIAIAIGAALQYAHKKGVIHRDIKPGNIMMCKDDQYVLFDFGLGKSEHHKALTMTGTVKGTLEYIAPEQLRDEPETQKTDVFLLGQTLFHMLSADLPLTGDIHTIPPLILGERNPYRGLTSYPHLAEVCEELDTLVEVARKRDPADRYTLDEFMLRAHAIRNNSSLKSAEFRGRTILKTESDWSLRKKEAAHRVTEAETKLYILQRQQNVDALRKLALEGKGLEALKNANDMIKELAPMPESYNDIKKDVCTFLLTMARACEIKKQYQPMSEMLAAAKIYTTMLNDEKLDNKYARMEKRFKESHAGTINMLKIIHEQSNTFQQAITDLTAIPDKTKAEGFIAQIDQAKQMLGVLKRSLSETVFIQTKAGLDTQRKAFEAITSSN